MHRSYIGQIVLVGLGGFLRSSLRFALGGLVHRAAPGSLFLLTGVLGGFTTFSSFAYETLGLIHASEAARALANTAANILLGLLAAWAGYVGALYL